jgi:DNA helicase-2/ATP-dependent DNA helicase PcrA
MALSDKQEEAACATEKSLVVTGGAGSGKTHIALEAAVRHLGREGIPLHSRVLFVTFSRTAVAQIRDRGRLIPRELEDRLEIVTFHGLCFRLLSAFGEYVGVRPEDLEIRSASQNKIPGSIGSGYSYDELIATTISLLEVAPVREIVQQRWSLVICDEFQDTGAEQSKILKIVSGKARIVVLGDPNQMIYSFLPGVNAQRLSTAIEKADRHVALEPASHRDASGVIPAMADAIRIGEFESEAVGEAVASGRLSVLTEVSEPFVECVRIIEGLLESGREEIGVFVTTHKSVRALGAVLTEAKITYSVVGDGEAPSEAILAQALLMGFACGTADAATARRQVGVFVAACNGGANPPPSARAIAGESHVDLELQEVTEKLIDQLKNANSTATKVTLIRSFIADLGLTNERSVWDQAFSLFSSELRKAGDPCNPEQLLRECKRNAVRGLVDYQVKPTSAVRIMNIYQTKGREVDSAVLAFEPNAFVPGQYEDADPESEAARTLYVALTRARREVFVLVPPSPHELIAGFLNI